MADLWGWYHNLLNSMEESGEAQTAREIEQFAQDCYDGALKKAESSYPALLLYARGQKNTWLEIFLRHWLLQLRYKENYRMGESLTEALELIRLTKTEDAAGCPQNICAVQDLARCYSARDSLGSAEVVLQVASETFAELTPDIPCYQCVGAEKAYALRKNGKPQEAMDLLNQVYFGTGQMRKNDPNKPSHYYKNSIGVFLHGHYELEDYDEVLKLYKEYLNSGHAQSHYKDIVALAYIKKGDYQAAAECVSPFEYLVSENDFSENWGEAIEKLASHGTIENTPDLGNQLRKGAEFLQTNGIWRDAFNLYNNAANLALLRNATGVALLNLLDMKTALSELIQPMGADEEILKLQNAIYETIQRPALHNSERALDESLQTIHADSIHHALAELNEAVNRTEPLLTAYTTDIATTTAKSENTE